MEVIITLIDIEKGDKAAVAVGVKFLPPPSEDTPETPASRLADRLWKIIKEEQERLAIAAPSRIVDGFGEPIPAAQGVCSVCGKVFARVFSEIDRCPACRE